MEFYRTCNKTGLAEELFEQLTSFSAAQELILNEGQFD